jgi:hypothetical protein
VPSPRRNRADFARLEFVVSPDESPRFGPDAVHAKYSEERDKRLVEGRVAMRESVPEGAGAK